MRFRTTWKLLLLVLDLFLENDSMGSMSIVADIVDVFLTFLGIGNAKDEMREACENYFRDPTLENFNKLGIL